MSKEEKETTYYVKSVYIDRLRVRQTNYTPPSSDFLKYYRVVRYWAREKHGLNQSTFEILQFLYSERVFTKSKYLQYLNIFGWDSTRWKSLHDTELIMKFRVGTREERALYSLTPKAKRIMKECYDKLNGKQTYSELPHKNVFLDKNKAGYVMRTMGLKMKEINKEINQKRIDSANRAKSSE